MAKSVHNFRSELHRKPTSDYGVNILIQTCLIKNPIGVMLGLSMETPVGIFWGLLGFFNEVNLLR